MDSYISHDAAETRRLGARVAERLGPGWVIGLTGDLGAGKTQFVKGVADALGVRGRVTSPTFALVCEHHDGKHPLHHLDLYRLESTDQILGAGLEEYFAPTDALCVIEWIERWQGPPPPRFCRVNISIAPDDTRTLHVFHDPPLA